MSESATTSVDKKPTNNSVAITARAKATQQLIARHQTEFDQLHGDEREKVGLPRKSGSDKRSLLLKRLDAQEKKLAALRKELEALANES